METTLSDALVFFGATGGLAYKQIFPVEAQALIGADGPWRDPKPPKAG